MILQLFMAFLGSVGFALLFGLRPRLLLPAALGGLLSWGLYLLGRQLELNAFFACLFASAFAAVWSLLLARLLHSPSTLFFITAAVPLIPGSTLFYMTGALVQGDFRAAADYGNSTLLFALAIAGGMLLVSMVSYPIQRLRRLHTEKQK